MSADEHINPQQVPASVKVRTSRVGNIDTDRLTRRAAWLAENKGSIAKEADGRKRLRDVAREILTIDQELQRRQQ